jgi:hypothetical protein
MTQLRVIGSRRRRSLHNADIWQTAVFLGVVYALADDEHIADREADKVDRDFDLPPLWLVEQCACPEIADPVLAQLGRSECSRSAGIDDVVDEQYGASGTSPKS